MSCESVGLHDIADADADADDNNVVDAYEQCSCQSLSTAGHTCGVL